MYSWLGEQQAQQGTGATVRPDGYGRYLLPDGEITFYLEIDRGSESTRRIKAKLDSYQQALAADPHRDRGNILLSATDNGGSPASCAAPVAYSANSSRMTRSESQSSVVDQLSGA